MAGGYRVLVRGCKTIAIMPCSSAEQARSIAAAPQMHAECGGLEICGSDIHMTSVWPTPAVARRHAERLREAAKADGADSEEAN
jgi:hypothetical protein